METAPVTSRQRTCRVCGKKFDYPVKESPATRHHCGDCVIIPEEIRKTLERLSTRVTQLENTVRRLQGPQSQPAQQAQVAKAQAQ
jgi:hypothetical protein